MMRLPDIIELRERRENLRRDWLEYQARQGHMTSSRKLRCRALAWLGGRFVAWGQHLQEGAAAALATAATAPLEGSS